jgi:hypothetical protein
MGDDWEKWADDDGAEPVISKPIAVEVNQK